MNIVQLSPANRCALKVSLPYEAHNAVFVTYKAGRDGENHMQREKLFPEAELIWDELSVLPGVTELAFARNDLTIMLTPAIDGTEVLPYLERYFARRFDTMSAPSEADKGSLVECASALLSRRRIAVERSLLGECVILRFRQQIYSGTFGEIAVRRGRSPIMVLKKQVTPSELYDALREVAKMKVVGHVFLEPYAVTIERHPLSSIERSLDRIVSLIKVALYGKSDCEVSRIDPYRPTKEEERNAKNYGRYRDRD